MKDPKDMTLQEVVEVLDNGFLNFSRKLAKGDAEGAYKAFDEAASVAEKSPLQWEALGIHKDNKDKLHTIRRAERAALGSDLEVSKRSLAEVTERLTAELGKISLN